MLVSLATVIVSSVLAQDPGAEAQGPEPLLSAADASALNKKVAEQVGIEVELLVERDAKKRRRLLAKLEKARAALEKEWEAKERRLKDTSLLASMADLEAIFAGCIPYERAAHTNGEVKAARVRDGEANYSFVLSRAYRGTGALPTVLLLPGLDGEAYDTERDYFEATWKGSALAEEALFVIPDVDDELELDAIPNYALPNAHDQERDRLGAVLGPAGHAQRIYDFDRARFTLDCGRGAARFGLRIATYFPSRFSALVLRDVPDVGELRIESLSNLPILLVADASCLEQAKALKARIDALPGGRCELIDAAAEGGEYPYGALQARISEWSAAQVRDLFPARVAVAPNSDSFGRKAYWVEVGTMESLGAVAVADQPYLDVVADRATNTITVTTKNVWDFALHLNDGLVDLEKEFKVVINGVVVPDRRPRSRDHLIETIVGKYDPYWLVTARWQGSVPKPDGEKEGTGGGEK